MIIVLAKMSQASGSKLNGQLQGQGFNRPNNGKRFKFKQERSKFKSSTGVDLLYGKVPILLHKVLSLLVQVTLLRSTTLVIRDNVENFEGSKSLKELEVEALFGGLVNKNGYKYMQCGNPRLIACIKNLGMVLH